MILSSKQEMVTRRPGAALNDLQLSSQKKKKKFSNNRQIVAGLPEGKLGGCGGWGLGTHLLKAYCVPCPCAVMYRHPTVGADANGEGIHGFTHSWGGGGVACRLMESPRPLRIQTGLYQALILLGVGCLARAPVRA